MLRNEKFKPVYQSMHFLCYFSKSKTGKFYDTVFSGWQGLNKQGSLDMRKGCRCSSSSLSRVEQYTHFLIHLEGAKLSHLLTLDHSSVDTAMSPFEDTCLSFVQILSVRLRPP